MMIKESLYFTYGNDVRKSTDFHLLNVSVGGGLFEEAMLSNRSIVEQTVNGNPIPYFNRVDRTPITIPLSFYFEETWNDELIDDICDWLDVEYYQPLAFSSNFDRVFYAMPVESMSLIHNGLKQGYVTLNMRCDSPFAYSPVIEDYFDFSTNSTYANFSIDNRGRLDILPVIEIRKVGFGDIIIRNFSKANSEFIFKNINDGEILSVDCQKRIINSSLDVSRYDNFNQNYLSLPYGLNQLQIYGSCILRFRYSFRYKALTI